MEIVSNNPNLLFHFVGIGASVCLAVQTIEVIMLIRRKKKLEKYLNLKKEGKKQ